jgi:hypothetical protein
MLKHNALKLGAIMSVVLFLSSCQKDPVNITNEQDATPPSSAKKSFTPTVRVFATGLNNPRGLKFGPDGYLYVAEGGIGGTFSSIGMCEQVVFPVGPYLGSTNGSRISRISHSGVRTTAVGNLPSSQTNEIIGGDVSGVADVAFIGNTLYALFSGAGCSHGVPSIPNGIIKVKPDGSWTMIANLSSWLMAHPVLHPEPRDFEPDGTFYSMINANGNLYVVEPNHGDFIKVTKNGNISRVVDISASQGHIVPTVVAYDDDKFFIGNLGLFPIVDGSSKILKVSQGGHVSTWATGFTTILGLIIDKKENMYVLENTTGAPFPTPGTGRIIRINHRGVRKTIVTGLNLPTGITLGPDGKLYVSAWGFGPVARGGGQVLQIDINKGHDKDEEEEDDDD